MQQIKPVYKVISKPGRKPAEVGSFTDERKAMNAALNLVLTGNWAKVVVEIGTSEFSYDDLEEEGVPIAPS